MKPVLVNPKRLIDAARNLARHLEDPQCGAIKWPPPMRRFYDSVVNYEAKLRVGGKKGSKKK